VRPNMHLALGLSMEERSSGTPSTDSRPAFASTASPAAASSPPATRPAVLREPTPTAYTHRDIDPLLTECDSHTTPSVPALIHHATLLSAHEMG
jgi:hypothetical protein